MVETLTKVATSSITSTKLAIATLAALAAGGAAFAASPVMRAADLTIVNNGVYPTFDNNDRQVSVVVQNIGNVASPATVLKFVWEGPSGVIIQPLTQLSVPAMKPSAIKKFFIAYPAAVMPIKATFNANPDKTFREKTYDNNILISNVPSLCVDSDGGLNTSVSGTASGCQYEDCAKILSVSDCCKSYVYPNTSSTQLTACMATGTHVLEGTCSNHQLVVPLVECQYGCSNGVCITPPSFKCVDTDGGDNMWVFGTTTETNLVTGEKYTGVDACVPGKSDYVTEMYCSTSTNQVYGHQVWCGDGNICKNGACVAAPSSTLTIIPACQVYFGCSANGSDGYVSTSAIVGEFIIKNSVVGESSILKSVKLKLDGDFILFNSGDNQVPIFFHGNNGQSLGIGTITSLDNGQSAEVVVNLSDGIVFTDQIFFGLTVNLTDSDFGFPANSISPRYLQVTVTGFDYQKDTVDFHSDSTATDIKHNYKPAPDKPLTVSVSSRIGSLYGNPVLWLSGSASDDVQLSKMDFYMGDHNGLDLPLVSACDGLTSNSVTCERNFDLATHKNGYFYVKVYNIENQEVTSEIKQFNY